MLTSFQSQIILYKWASWKIRVAHRSHNEWNNCKVRTWFWGRAYIIQVALDLRQQLGLELLLLNNTWLPLPPPHNQVRGEDSRKLQVPDARKQANRFCQMGKGRSGHTRMQGRCGKDWGGSTRLWVTTCEPMCILKQLFLFEAEVLYC